MKIPQMGRYMSLTYVFDRLGRRHRCILLCLGVCGRHARAFCRFFGMAVYLAAGFDLKRQDLIMTREQVKKIEDLLRTNNH